jgi:lipopolysaccharide/colanic/teichoic acid biosynthesis glycosyltransferase
MTAPPSDETTTAPAPAGRGAPDRFPFGRGGMFRYGGYRVTDFWTSLLFNVPTAIMLFMVTLPFFLVIPLIIWIVDGRPIFYRGERMGRNKVPFMMYKFRTLKTDAERQVGGKTLSSSDRLETRTGKLLRETRLDELPQLINIIRGDMALVGPRPEREAVYESQCKDIPGYDKRFEVKPGVLGYSQLFTPHSAPKRARALLDNYYVRRRQKWFVDIIFFAFALMWLAQRAAAKSLKIGYQLCKRVFKRHSAANNRASERLSPPQTTIAFRLAGSKGAFKDAGEIDDISDDGVVFYWPEDLGEVELELRLHIEGEFPPCRGVKRKTAKAAGKVIRVWNAREKGRRHVVQYVATAPLDLLLIHQYFLDKAIA